MTTSPPPYAVRRTSTNEQQLVATRGFAAGELVIAERALVHVPVARYRYGTYAWDLVDRLLADPELLKQFNRCQLRTSAVLPHPEDLRTEDVLVKKYKKSRQLVHSIFLGVATNNIGIIDPERKLKGHGLFPILSRSDHSCEPNTQLTPANWRAAEASLVTTREVKAGEPLTWCYFREPEFLEQDWVTRNYNIVNLYRFACRCSRCQAERPADVPSSPAGQVAYIDKLIMADARDMVRAAEVEDILQQLSRTSGASTLLAPRAK